MSVVILDAGPMGVVQFDGSAAAAGYILRSLTGWLGSTSAKVDLVERSAGDGAHDVMDAQILYSARTVSVEYPHTQPAAPADSGAGHRRRPRSDLGRVCGFH